MRQKGGKGMVTFTIEREISELSTSGSTSKRLTVTTWNDNPAKLDLRVWRDVGGEQLPGKGITLTDNEAEVLRDALIEYLG